MINEVLALFVGLFLGAVVLAVICAVAVRRGWSVLNVVGCCLIGMLGVLGVTILYACNVAECPNCKWEIKRGVPSCPNCKAGLRWK